MSDPLLTAVDRLTLPVTDHIAQKDDDGKWLRGHVVVVPSLLNRFHDRAMGLDEATSDGGAAKAAPRERSIVDLNALYQYSKIASAIRSWCLIIGITPDRDASANTTLVTWYEALPPEFDSDWHRRELARWAALIDEFLHPGERFESDFPCPVCKGSGWGDAINGGSTRAILVTYEKDEAGSMVNERAACRIPGCNTVWVGHESVVELATEMHEATG